MAISLVPRIRPKPVTTPHLPDFLTEDGEDEDAADDEDEFQHAVAAE